MGKGCLEWEKSHMRKRVIGPTPPDPTPNAPGWLDVAEAVEVELTSEDAGYPIEDALQPGSGRGWRAAEPGGQVIRLLFDIPQRIQRVRLVFREEERARTQEFALRWSADPGDGYREVVRQQFNFSPPGTTVEIEDYSVNLERVSVLELTIVPDVSGAGCRASLAEWRLG